MLENEIIEKCKEGELSAYEMIYNRYEQPLLRTALSMLGQRQDAEDAVQMTFIRLYRGIRKFRHEAKFSTYLFRILMNVCFDQIEKKNKMKCQTLDTVNPSHSSGIDLQLQIKEAIDALPDQQKACFILFSIEERQQSEIAEIMGLSLGGVKSNIHHAKNRLRSMLE